LQHFAGKTVSVAVPNTRNKPEYAAYRKMQVYEVALAESLERDLQAGLMSIAQQI
jgi:hypothetical protein